MIKDLILKRTEEFVNNMYRETTFFFIEQVGKIIQETQNRNGKILLCGNGGSSAQASHFAAELMGRYKKKKNEYFAIALGSDGTVNSAIANDYGFENVFSYQIKNLASCGDVLLVLSSSGNSENVVRALKQAKALGVITFALLGKDGGLAKAYSDYYYLDTSQDTAVIQEHHLTLIHLICEYLER